MNATSETMKKNLSPEEAERIKKAIKKKGIVWTPDVKVRQHQEQATSLLRLIAVMFYCDDPESADDWLAHSFASDESTLGDFLHEEGDGQIKKLSEALGFPVEMNNYIWEVALRMKPPS